LSVFILETVHATVISADPVRYAAARGMTRTRIFFTSDIHGSDTVFMKFLNAGKFYKADAIIAGGDITGKMIVPIIELPGGKCKAYYLGSEMIIKSRDALAKFEKLLHSAGYYVYRADEAQMSEFSADPKKIDDLFLRLMLQRIDKWVQIADEKLGETKTKCFVLPGNDDRYDIDDALRRSQSIINPEGTVQQMDSTHEMISTGYANITPWRCPRDIPEEELEAKIEKMARGLKNPSNAIFCFHVPPYNTLLDIAPVLDDNLKPQMEPGGSFKMGPVGSTSVRKAIEKHQPVLGLHGHIHESRASMKIGATLCLNPGSEYGEGILRGVVIELDEKKVKDYAFTQG
jgi:hypothetical protein